MPKARSTPPSVYQRELFACIPFVSTRLVRERAYRFADRAQVRSPAEVAELLYPYFADKDREELVAVLLDTAHTVQGLSVLAVGGLAACIVEPRQVFKVAILANAAALVLVHQHPSGNPEPSCEDIAVTRKMVEAGRLLEIPVLDHLIISEDQYTSLAERGLLI
ncbi:MAG: JAB domain-containing protein [Rhodothermales bacterium]